MGIRIADVIDSEDFDIYETDIIIHILEDSLTEEDGTLTIENHLILQEERKKIKRYQYNKDRLYAHAYGKISTILYQIDKRGLHTEEEGLQQIRGIKQQTTEIREKLQEKYIKLGHLGDIQDFNQFIKEESELEEE